ncbi:hypothetical protein EZ216_20325 [Ramlibacter humi]|uniref:MaoC-like domain-containing protein n=2 Tax=Ramlibacter humi TaxID=2530451 RepID=A0A4Z0BEV3_9BURK|nr:hypothetical protein EZ216_20325 [Ramlibacter humi]
MARRQVHLTREVFQGFAAVSGDAHPLHYDAAYAKSHGLRAPIAHGLLLVAITALGATPLSAQLHDSMVAMLGTQARFISPAYEGDRVDVSLTVLEIQPKSRNRCVAAFEVKVERGAELLASVQHQFMLRFSREEAAA